MGRYVGRRRAWDGQRLNHRTVSINPRPSTHLISVSLIGELAAATILGIEIFQQNGREIDLEHVASALDQGIRLLSGFNGPGPSQPST
jgi:hypothetical protein